jgi:putative acetyltransferase
VIALGHPGYCPRLGFGQASGYGIRCQLDDVPREAFMILVMVEGAMSGASGRARYRGEWDAVT